MKIIRLTRNIAISYLIMVSTFWALMIAVHLIPADSIRENVKTSANILDSEGNYKRFLGIPFMQLDNYTDGIMLQMAMTADSDKPVEAATMNYLYTPRPELSKGANAGLIADGVTDAESMWSYSRYWHGYMITLRPMLCIFSHKGIRVINYALFTAIFCVVLILMAKKISKAVAIIFTLCSAAVFFPIVPMSLQYSTCFYLMLLSTLGVLTIKHIERHAMLYFFIVGGISSFMDLLTTPLLTLSIPVAVYLLRFPQQSPIKTLFAISITWAMGYSMVFAGKWAITYFAMGYNVFQDVGKQSSLWLGVADAPSSLTIIDVIGNIINKIPGGIYSFSLLALSSIIAISWVAVTIWRKKDRIVCNWLLLIALMAPAWMCILISHTCAHYYFVFRVLLGSLFPIAVYVWINRHAATLDANHHND